MEVGHHTYGSRSKSPTISKRVNKFFPGMGCFAGNIDGTRQDDNGNTYEILFEDGDTEEWRQEKYDKNVANSCIPTGKVVFGFIKKFSGGYFFQWPSFWYSIQ